MTGQKNEKKTVADCLCYRKSAFFYFLASHLVARYLFASSVDWNMLYVEGKLASFLREYALNNRVSFLSNFLKFSSNQIAKRIVLRYCLIKMTSLPHFAAHSVCHE